MPLSVVYINVDGQPMSEIRGGVVTEYVHDPLGNLIATHTSAGVVTWTGEYWPYGETMISSGTKVNNWGFCAAWGYYDDGYDNSYVRRRVLRRKLARWQTVDPIWPRERAYGYASLEPTSKIDKFGMRPRPHKLPPSGVSSPLIPWNFSYGSYCGSANKRNPNWNVLPQDCVDECCQNHDRCLEAHYGANYGGAHAHGCCAAELYRCALRATTSGCCYGSPLPNDCLKAADLINYVFFQAAYTLRLCAQGCLSKSDYPMHAENHWGGDLSIPIGVGTDYAQQSSSSPAGYSTGPSPQYFRPPIKIPGRPAVFE